MNLIQLTILLCDFLTYSVSLQLLGIIMELLGAYYLSRTFLFKRTFDIKMEAFGLNSTRLHSGFAAARNQFFNSYVQMVEAKLGFILVLMGLTTEAFGLCLSYVQLSAWLLILISLFVLFVAEISRKIFSGQIRIQKAYDAR